MAKPASNGSGTVLFACLTGLFCAVTLAKIGNPVILDKMVSPPADFLEALFQPWPVKWGYFLLIPVLLLGLSSAFSSKTPRTTSPPASQPEVRQRFIKVMLLLPLVWLGWQFVSGTKTVDATLTSATLKHFCACLACFYLGYFALGRIKNPWPVWLGLSLAFAWILREGFSQHFGGLEETRRYFYQMPNWQNASPDFIKKIQSNRIFSTLFYPNTLAGVILMVLPIVLVFVWEQTARFSALFRSAAAAVICFAALACLYWSGSKSGWLIAVCLGAVALWHSRLAWRKWVIAILLIIGLTGFAVRYAKFFQSGATSAAARFDYWRAAWQTTKEHPLFGTGPGTFSIPYKAIKSPESEMARLTHNDYLQQASDSGFIGLLTYTIFIIGSIIWLYRYSTITLQAFAIWLGLLGIVLHSFVEFHLYIPAVAWPFFLMLGWLWGTRGKQVEASVD